jgi:hypothetical protein
MSIINCYISRGAQLVCSFVLISCVVSYMYIYMCVCVCVCLSVACVLVWLLIVTVVTTVLVIVVIVIAVIVTHWQYTETRARHRGIHQYVHATAREIRPNEHSSFRTRRFCNTWWWPYRPNHVQFKILGFLVTFDSKRSATGCCDITLLTNTD